MASSAVKYLSRSAIGGDLLDGLPGVSGEDFVEHVFGLDDLFGLNLDVGGLAGDAAVGLVDHDLGVGEDVSSSGRAGGEEYGAAGVGTSDAVGGDIGGDELHGVVDGEGVIHGAAGGVDVEVDFLSAFLIFEVEHLHHDAGGGGVVDFADEEDHAVFEHELVDGHFACALVGHGGEGIDGLTGEVHVGGDGRSGVHREMVLHGRVAFLVWGSSSTSSGRELLSFTPVVRGGRMIGARVVSARHAGDMMVGRQLVQKS